MMLSRKVWLAASVPLVLAVAACGGGSAPTAETAADRDPHAAPVAAGDGSGTTIAISGAGATFPAPIFQRWFDAYTRQVDADVQVSYQSVGSGAGLEQYIAGTVDFGASEAPITDAADRTRAFVDAFGYAPIQVPITGGLLSFSYNLPGIDDRELRLSRAVYCGIVTGEITRWGDPAIAAINPDLEIPDLPITWVHRSDGSGTTFVFVNHIDTVCDGWAGGVGTSVDWPVGSGDQGNEGVAATIQQTEGAIGYLSYAYAALEGLDSAMVENNAGNYVEPSPETAGNALLGEAIPDDFALLVPDPTGENAYPIVGLTWVMIYNRYEDEAQWNAMRDVFEWSLGPEGRAIAEELLYVPLPEPLVERIQEVFDTVNAG